MFKQPLGWLVKVPRGKPMWLVLRASRVNCHTVSPSEQGLYLTRTQPRPAPDTLYSQSRISELASLIEILGVQVYNLHQAHIVP